MSRPRARRLLKAALMGSLEIRRALALWLGFFAIGMAAASCNACVDEIEYTPPSSDGGYDGGCEGGGACGGGGGAGGAGGGPCSEDLQTDADNCGRCGRSCGGDACEDGRCPVRSLAATGNYNYGLAADATHAYWTAGESSEPGGLPYSVSKVPTDGGDVVRLFESDEVAYWHPSGIAIDDTLVYWTALWAGGIHQSGLDGSGLEQIASMNKPTNIALAGETLVVAGYNSPNGTVARIHASRADALLASGLDNPLPVATDGTHAYWAIIGTDGRGIWRAAIDGSDEPTLVTATDAPVGSMAIDGDDLYFHDEATAELVRLRTDGTERVELAPEASPVAGIVVDAERVYWYSTELGEIRSLRKDGSEAHLIATGQVPVPGALAANETSLFWLVAGELRTTPK